MIKEFSINRYNIIYDSNIHVFGTKNIMQIKERENIDTNSQISMNIPFISELQIHISNKCQLSCTYCYLNTMDCNKNVLDKKDLDEIFELTEKCDRVADNCVISYLGAEPTVEFEKIVYLTEKFKNSKRNYQFSISTNGYSICNSQIEYLQSNNFRIVISLDGDKSNHDLHRKNKKGEGTYDTIVRNIQSLKKGSFDIQSVITRDTHNVVECIKNHERLFPRQIKYYFEVGTEEWTDLQIENIKNEIGKLWDYFISRFEKNDIVPLRHNLRMLENIHSGNRQLYHCGAGISMFFWGNNKKIYPCNMRAYGNEMIKIAEIDNKIIDFDVSDNIDSNVTNEKKCKDCWAKYWCGGGCRANKSNICGILEYDIMYALYAYARLYDQNKELLLMYMKDIPNDKNRGYIKKIIDLRKEGKQ